MSTINYFNMYSLDFSYVGQLKEALKLQEEDEIRPLMENALKATTIRNGLEQRSLNKSMLIEFPQFKKAIELIDKASTAATGILEKYSDADPYELQEIVHRILGISKKPLAEELKQTYLKIMQQSGFLQLKDMKIKVGDQVAQLFRERPEIDWLNLGCGEAGRDAVGSCHFRREKDHDTRAMTIDLSVLMGPNIVVDMHDVEFWDAIPNEKFSTINDHSYGYFLFDEQRSNQTLSQIFRTLKPGASLIMDHAFKDEHKSCLREIGFILDETQQIIARKP